MIFYIYDLMRVRLDIYISNMLYVPPMLFVTDIYYMWMVIPLHKNEIHTICVWNSNICFSIWEILIWNMFPICEILIWNMIIYVWKERRYIDMLMNLQKNENYIIYVSRSNTFIYFSSHVICYTFDWKYMFPHMWFVTLSTRHIHPK